MKVQNKVQKNKGFTLIELVVVVAIIGVLAAIVTPRIRTALMKAKDAKAVATLDALRTATNVYYAEKGKIPYFATSPDDGAPVDDKQPLQQGHLMLLVKTGYLDVQSAQKLDPDITQTEVDKIADIADITAVKPIPDMTVGVVQSRAASCTEDDNGVYQANSDAANTPGVVQFLWAKDGVGLHLTATLAAGAEGEAAPTDPANTSCELWESK